MGDILALSLHNYYWVKADYVQGHACNWVPKKKHIQHWAPKKHHNQTWNNY